MEIKLPVFLIKCIDLARYGLLITFVCFSINFKFFYIFNLNPVFTPSIKNWFMKVILITSAMV